LPDDGELVRVGAGADRTRRFAVGGHPGAIAAGSGGLWVAGAQPGALARLNLRTGRVEQTAQLASAPSLLAADPKDGSVWAVDAGGAVTHVSPSGAVLDAPVTISPKPVAVAAGEPNWLWAVNGSLVRVGNRTRPHPFDVRADPVAVTLDQGVWTAHANGHVTRFNPIFQYLNVNTDARVAPELDAISAVEKSSAVWAISRQAKRLYRLSATAPGAPITGTVTFGSAPVALAATDGGVWVATADGVVTQISG
jgi:streptogramin lyase